MALKGDLASVDLAQVFQMLALNQKVGLLLITAPRGWKALYFGTQGASLYFDEHVLLDKVLLQASQAGRITPESAQEARHVAAEEGVGLADAVLGCGELTAKELGALIRDQMEEEIYDLFFWTDAHFEFYEGATTLEGREGQVDERFSLPPDSLIMEAARRIDEWGYIEERVEGPQELFRPVGNAANYVELDDASLAVYDLVDGKRTVDRLIELTGLAPFLCYKSLALLLDEALIERVPPADFVGLAEEARGEGRLQDAVAVYERALASGTGDAESHEQVAACYEHLQEYELAAYHYKCVGEVKARSEDVAGAVAVLQHVVELLPTDLSARERIVELTVGREDLASADFDPVAAGKQLVDLYLETGEIERVRSILERLLRDNPYDVELKKGLINVHSKAGDTKRVVELYESIADDMVQRRKPIEAVKYLQKIVMIDRSRKDVSERIRTLYELDERRRSRRRSVMAVIALLLLLGAMAGAWYVYDQRATERFEALQERAAQWVDAEEFEQARAAFIGFRDTYPLTFAESAAEVELMTIDGLIERRDQQRQARVKQRQEELARIRKRYDLAYKIYQELLDGGELDQALEQLTAVRAMVYEEAGEPVDLEWAEKHGIDQQIRESEQIIGEAAALERKARELLRVGDWQEARRLWTKILEDDALRQSPVARTVRLPVRVESQPPGAVVSRAGEVVEVDGAPARTPVVLLFEPDDAAVLDLSLAGFQPEAVRVTPRADVRVHRVLTMVPVGRHSFVEPVRGDMTAQRGMLAVGLRNGKVGIVGLGGESELRTTIDLEGLDDLMGRVAFAPSQVVMLTKQGRILGHALPEGRRMWSLGPLSARPLFEPVLTGSRAVFVDEAKRLFAIDIHRANGPSLLTIELPEQASAAPSVEGRIVRVGCVDGSVLVIDLLEREVIARTNVRGSGISTRIEAARGALFFGTTDGFVRAYREADLQPMWSRSLGENCRPEHLLLSNGALFVRTDDDRILQLALTGDGRIEAERTLDGRAWSGPVAVGDRVYVAVRRRDDRDREEDVLLAFDRDALAPAWEFRDGGRFSADIAVSNDSVFVADSRGDVLVFR